MIALFFNLVRFEIQRLGRSPMRLAAMVVFLLCGFYAISSGLHHVNDWQETLKELSQRDDSRRTEAIGWFDDQVSGPDDRDWIDVTTIRYADRYASAHAVMEPEPLAALAIGLSDIRSTWAVVSATMGAEPFRTSDPSTLGNAEKLLSGNFDLAFVLAYLMPLLLLVLMFDVSSMERDLGILRTVRTQTASPKAWWLLRVSLPILVVLILVGSLLVVGGIWTGALEESFDLWKTFSLASLGYVLLWGLLYAAVLSAGTGSSTAALWMVGLWISFCVLVPAAVRQVVSSLQPNLYASELTTVLRAERYEILLGEVETYAPGFYAARPQISPPAEAPDRANQSSIDRMIREAAFFDEVALVSAKTAKREAVREGAVSLFGWINPAYVFQNSLCVLAGTESVNFRAHRNDILAAVQKRLESLITLQWKMEPIEKPAFETLFAHENWRRHGKTPQQTPLIQGASLGVVAIFMTALLSRNKRARERKTGVV